MYITWGCTDADKVKSSSWQLAGCQSARLVSDGVCLMKADVWPWGNDEQPPPKEILPYDTPYSRETPPPGIYTYPTNKVIFRKHKTSPFALASCYSHYPEIQQKTSPIPLHNNHTNHGFDPRRQQGQGPHHQVLPSGPGCW